MMKFLILFFSLFLCMCGPGVLAQSVPEQQNIMFPGYFSNAGFEQKLTSWSYTGTPTYPKTTGNKIRGQGLQLVFSSVNGTILEQTFSSCADLAGKNLLAGIHIKTASSNIEVCYQSNGADVKCNPVANDNVMKFYSANTASQGAESCGIRVKTTTSTSGTIVFDDARLMENPNVGSVAQSRAVFRAYRSTTAQSITSTAWTKVQPNTELYDNDNAFDSVTNFRFTPKELGYYYFTGSVYTLNYTAAERMLISIAKNGDTTNGLVCVNVAYSAATTSYRVSVSCTAKVTSLTDYYEMFAKSDADAAYDIGAATSGSGQDSYFEANFIPDTAAQAVRDNQTANLIGTVFYEPSSTCPANAVEVNGQTLSGSQYAALIAHRTAKGISSPATLENLSGLFIRTTGTQTQGGIAQTAGTIRTYQADQMQGHWHAVNDPGHGHTLGANWTGGNQGAYNMTNGSSGPSNGNDGTNVAGTAENNTTGLTVRAPSTDGTNGTPRTGTTTRPANMAMTACMWFVSQPATLTKGGVQYSNTVQAGGADGVTSISGGTYIPTLSNLANLANATVIKCFQSRQGQLAQVDCYISLSCSVVSTPTSFVMTLPYVSNVTTASDVIGQLTAAQNDEVGWVYGESGKARIDWNCKNIAASGWRSINFTYEIK